jgi:hypothetical protein
MLGLPLAAEIKVSPSADRIEVVVDGKPFTTFFVGADAPKPYLHPLRSASGKIVTRGYPMENIEGEDKDHPHHRGLWFTHGEVNGFDFWANESTQKGATRNGKGRIVTKKVVSTKGGKKSGSIAADFEWQNAQGRGMLTESRSMTFYSDPKLRVIDFDIRLISLEPVHFGDTKEGTFAIRLLKSMEEKHGGKMTNAGGASTEQNVWGKRSPWVDYVGQVDGETLGVAILDHPSNPRHPTYWHSRAYGLFAANIFGVADFERDKTKDGSLHLEPSKTLQFRYRVIIHSGDAAAADIAGQFRKYAAMD